MEETDLHDLSDDADYAASQQQVNVNLLRNSSLKRNSSSELDGAEIVYVKDNVAIHPIQYDTERICGRLKLIMQGSSLFLTWIPYKELTPNQRLNEIDRNLYTIREVPFKDIRSIRRHTPTLGWQYVIVVLSSGLAYPPLYFYSGGVKEFLATIKQHVFLVRSAEDANVFLVNELLHPLQRTISSLELPGPVSVANGLSSPRSIVGPCSNEIHEIDGIASQIKQNGRQIHKSQDPARDISINVLEKFSMVTKFARDTTSHLFREYHGDGFGAREWRDHSSPSFDLDTSTDTQKVPQETPESSDPLEFDKWKLIPGQPRQPPLGSEEWSGFLDSEGRIVDPEALRKRIFYGGVDCKLRSEVWPFLLGYHAYDSTYAEREYLVSLKKSQYETIKNQWQSISDEQAKRFTKFRERKSLIEKDVVRTDRALSFYDGDDNPNVNRLHDILLTYSFYNFDLGYCQGMSDLLSPILVIVQDDSEAFWCFVALMERFGPNFNRDQNGMHSQLFALSKVVELLDGPLHNYFMRKDCLNYFFCFRWLLIQFKREFEFESTMLLWEVMWTHYLSEHIHLYVCVAILKRHRQKIMDEQMDFDTLLKFINDLSGNIDLDSALSDAEALCICAGQDGAALIPPGTPPSLPIKAVSFYNQLDQDEVL